MPAERVPMRDAREIIRLKFSAGLATREIARRLGVAPSTVRETLRRLSTSGLSWAVAEGLSEAELEAALYAGRGSKRGHRLHAEPDWPAIHRELKRKHVTLQSSRTRTLLPIRAGRATAAFVSSMARREDAVADDAADACGGGAAVRRLRGRRRPVVVDRLTGEVRMAQIFVAVLGASSFTFAQASWTQTLPDWIDAHVRALTAIGGVPQLIVPDNRKPPSSRPASMIRRSIGRMRRWRRSAGLHGDVVHLFDPGVGNPCRRLLFGGPGVPEDFGHFPNVPVEEGDLHFSGVGFKACMLATVSGLSAVRPETCSDYRVGTSCCPVKAITSDDFELVEIIASNAQRIDDHALLRKESM